MTKTSKIASAIVALAVLGAIVFFLQKKPENQETQTPVVENQILGKFEDLVDFSILPGSKLSGLTAFDGAIKGGWFFEANIQINILDLNKKVLKASYATATSDWQTAEPVKFEGKIDLSDLPKGPAYFEIHNDNASALPENDKFIQIPIVIE